MNNWVLSVCATIMLSVIAGLIVPRGKIGGFIKSMFSLITIIVIIQPLVNLKNGEYTFNLDSNLETSVQKDFLDYANFKKTEALEKDAINFLKDNGYDADAVIIDVDDFNLTYKIKKIYVYFNKSVIKPNDANIDIIDEITEMLIGYFNVDKGVISVYARN